MRRINAFLMFAAGTIMVSAFADAQTPVPPTLPGRPQIQPPRPGGPQVQPPRPVQPIVIPPRPGGPQIQPPRPPRPQPPRPPIRPPVVIVNPGWGHLNPGWAYGRAVLFSREYYSGNYLTVRSNIPDLRVYGFDNRGLSLHARGRWQVCSKTNYRGKCLNVVGSGPSLGRLAGKVSSIRFLGR